MQSWTKQAVPWRKVRWWRRLALWSVGGYRARKGVLVKAKGVESLALKGCKSSVLRSWLDHTTIATFDCAWKPGIIGEQIVHLQVVSVSVFLKEWVRRRTIKFCCSCRYVVDCVVRKMPCSAMLVHVLLYEWVKTKKIIPHNRGFDWAWKPGIIGGQIVHKLSQCQCC
jgi:hypothetical protein